MHSDLYVYPPEPPPGLLRVIIDALRGKIDDPKYVAHIAWHLAGYALSKWDTHLIGQPRLMTSADVADALAAYADAVERKASAAEAVILPDISWHEVLRVVLILLERLF